MAKRKGRVENLKAPRSAEEAREMGKRGGIASGKVRNSRKTFRETLKIMLSCTVPTTSPVYKRLKKQMKQLGMDYEPTVQDIPNLGMLTRAAKDPKAFVAIRDTIGEKPVDQTEDLTPPPTITLGLLPNVPPVAATDDDTEDAE